MAKIGERLKNSWNAFMGRDPTAVETPRIDFWLGGGNGHRPDRIRPTRNSLRSIVSCIYNKIAVDIAAVNIYHVKLDEDGNFIEIVNDDLNKRFTVEANIDQTGRAFIQDTIMSMLDEGCVALVPVDTDDDPSDTESYRILTCRVGRILEWFPDRIRVECYNERIGKRSEIIIEKRLCPILENPFYSVMNEPNSTAQRLTRVLTQLERTNDTNSSGKIDMLVQLPYAIKSDGKRAFAESRRRDLEEQMENSRYGIGYIDASERVIQLNRSVENNLWEQSEKLLVQLYNQLGLSEEVFKGTADEQTMLNYQNSTLEPILSEMTLEITRKWLSTTAISQRHAVKFYRDPFKLIPIGQIAEIADKFTRNCIMTSNEMRGKIGLRPSNDPKADELINSNLNHPEEKTQMEAENRSKGQEERSFQKFQNQKE